MVSGDEMNRYLVVLFTELVELTIVGDVLVEEVAGDDQVVDSKVRKGTKDVRQRVETLRVILTRGQMHISGYCDLQVFLLLWFL